MDRRVNDENLLSPPLAIVIIFQEASNFRWPL